MESYTENIDKLVGKNVIFLDLETTGFPQRGDKSMPGGYADYKDNISYDSSRILQIGWYYCEDFSKENFEFSIDDVKSIIRKPFNFKKVPNVVAKKHGITYERALAEGTYIKPILNGEFGACLLNCDCVVAYNAYFDFSILANEIHRTHYENMYNKMIELRTNIVCMMDVCKKYIGTLKTQKEAYKCMYLKDPVLQHDAKNDVFTMLEILSYVLKNPLHKLNSICDNERVNEKINPQNTGVVWSKKEDTELRKQYLDEERDIKNIAMLHKRSTYGIKCRLRKLGILKDTEKKQQNNINGSVIGKDIKQNNTGQKWSDNEDDELKKKYLVENKSIDEIALIHKRSEGGIRARLKRLEILKDVDDTYVPLDDCENEKIKTMYVDENRDIEEIAKIYSRTAAGIRARLKKLGILKANDCVIDNDSYQKIQYLENEIDKLKKLCDDLKKSVGMNYCQTN